MNIPFTIKEATVMILLLKGHAVREGEKVLVLMGAVWEKCFLAQHRQRAKLLHENEE